MTRDPPPTWFGQEGIDLRVDAQLALLRELEAPGYQDLFGRLRADAELSASVDGGRGRSRLARWLGSRARLLGSLRDRTGRTGRRPGPGPGESSTPISNDYFPSPDAELYAAMIARERPHRIVEVGSGFSTLVARHAVDHAALECELCVVDPEPRIDVGDAADRVLRLRVEQSGLDSHEKGELPPVGPGTLLFIDSTHVMEAGGDGPFLYCRLLPSLPAGVLVHVHDIYIPYDYPAVYVRWGYTEQYVLHALLTYNPRLQVVCAPYLLSREHPDAMRRAFGDGIAREHTFEGASFWMRTV